MTSIRRRGLTLDRIIKGVKKRIVNIIAFPLRNFQYFHYGKNSHIVYPVCKIVNKKNISIGDNSNIGKFVRLEPVVCYELNHYTPHIKIGNEVCINQNFHCTCAKSVIIGDGTSITANCGIFDIIHPYEDISVNPRFAEIIVKPVEIGQNCLIGMNSVILPGTKLGNHCVVGANSVVQGLYPDNCVIVGAPAKIVKRYNFSTKRWEKTNPDGSFIENK